MGKGAGAGAAGLGPQPPRHGPSALHHRLQALRLAGIDGDHGRGRQWRWESGSGPGAGGVVDLPAPGPAPAPAVENGKLIPAAMLPPDTSGVQLSPDEVARYGRHLILPEVGMEGQKRLKAAYTVVPSATPVTSAVSTRAPQVYSSDVRL